MMAAQFFAAIEAEAQRSPDDEPPKHGFVRTALRATRRALQSSKEETDEEQDSQ
jgi:hypothetical protein